MALVDARRWHTSRVCTSFLVGGLLASQSLLSQPLPFDGRFQDSTLRIDYFHTGGPGGEVVALDRIVSDGPWPGSRTRLVDETNLGTYRVLMRAADSGTIIYSRGFSSMYAEWETTPEAATASRTFHESLRVPWPRTPVTVTLERRGETGEFHGVWSLPVDPASRFVNRADRVPADRGWTILENGPTDRTVDLLIIGEGYRLEERTKLDSDARRLVEALFRHEPFASRRNVFSVRVLHAPSQASGIHRARVGEHRRTPLSTEFNIFDSERYVLTHDNRALRDFASAVPYEFIEILVNDRQYGGGGIFNSHATSSVDSAFSEYVFVHEFAHHFAGLADEYYTSDVAYVTGAPEHPEPWEPNVTALHDPNHVKWQEFVEPGTPVPTPWAKDAYERESAAFQTERRDRRAAGASESTIDELFERERTWSSAFLASQPHAGRVGAFEGAAYEPRGLYRPELDCVMFSRDSVGFCRVCRAAIDRIIDLYAVP